MFARVFRIALAYIAFALCPALAGDREPLVDAHAIAMRGDPPLPDGFERLPYASPEAGKGGTLELADLGASDSLKHTHQGAHHRRATRAGIRGFALTFSAPCSRA
jgi:peptide/nickel transport system substrate-binding protein